MFVALFQLVFDGSLDGVHVAPKTKITNQYQNNKSKAAKKTNSDQDRSPLFMRLQGCFQAFRRQQLRCLPDLADDGC